MPKYRNEEPGIIRDGRKRFREQIAAENIWQYDVVDLTRTDGEVLRGVLEFDSNFLGPPRVYVNYSFRKRKPIIAPESVKRVPWSRFREVNLVRKYRKA